MDERAEREVIESIRTVAKLARAFFDSAVEQKFTPAEALALTHTWLRGMSAPRPPA